MSKLLVAVIALGVSFAANANPVQLKFAGTNTTVNTTVRINGSNQNVAMGSYNLVEQGATPSNIVGFCVDPFESVKTDRNGNGVFSEYQKSSLDASDFVNNGATRFANVQKLFDNAYGSLSNAVQTAGFHLALWELFNDNGNTAQVTNDHVSVATDTIVTKQKRKPPVYTIVQLTDAGVLSYANTLLASLSGWSVKNEWDLTFYESKATGKGTRCATPSYQDFLTAQKRPSEVPLPAALPLFMSAICGFGVMSRRSKLG